VDSAAGVLDRGEAHDAAGAGFGIDLDVGDVDREGGATSLRFTLP